MTHDDPTRPLHASITTAADLTATANTWPDLLTALHPTQTRTTRRGSDPPPPINLAASQAIHEITERARFWARALLDETDWTPKASDTVTLLRGLAQRTGHFTEHEDRTLAAAFVNECADMRKLATRTAYPRGIRQIPIPINCLEDGCPGTYTARLDPTQRWVEIPDLTCTVNRRHVIPPDTLMRARRRATTTDPNAMRALLNRMRGAHA